MPFENRSYSMPKLFLSQSQIKEEMMEFQELTITMFV